MSIFDLTVAETKEEVSHTLCRGEEGSGHTVTIGLSPWQKLDVTNQIHILRRFHPAITPDV